MTSEPRRFARALRARQTSAEEALWHQLRDRRLGGAKWRRQVPLGPYVADFACLSARLVVELDGIGHDTRPIYDSERTRSLEAQGFQVIRFTNAAIRHDLDGVMRQLAEALRLARGD